MINPDKEKNYRKRRYRKYSKNRIKSRITRPAKGKPRTRTDKTKLRTGGSRIEELERNKKIDNKKSRN